MNTTTCATCGKQMKPAEAMHRLEGERIVHYCYLHWLAQRERIGPFPLIPPAAPGEIEAILTPRHAHVGHSSKPRRRKETTT